MYMCQRVAREEKKTGSIAVTKMTAVSPVTATRWGETESFLGDLPVASM